MVGKVRSDRCDTSSLGLNMAKTVGAIPKSNMRQTPAGANVSLVPFSRLMPKGTGIMPLMACVANVSPERSCDS
jgi:hypothetical protein